MLLCFFCNSVVHIFVMFRDRVDLMCHMKPSDIKCNNSNSGPPSSIWTLVDEGGEEVKVALSKMQPFVHEHRAARFVFCSKPHCFLTHNMNGTRHSQGLLPVFIYATLAAIQGFIKDLTVSMTV